MKWLVDLVRVILSRPRFSLLLTELFGRQSGDEQQCEPRRVAGVANGAQQVLRGLQPGATVVTFLCLFDNRPQGSLKQRMVKHGRDIADNWVKLEAYKRGCVTGCDLAARAEKSLSVGERASFHKNVTAEEAGARGGIIQADKVEEQAKLRSSWSDSMKNACLEACQTRFGDDKKGRHACSDGCDVFFQIIQK